MSGLEEGHESIGCRVCLEYFRTLTLVTLVSHLQLLWQGTWAESFLNFRWSLLQMVFTLYLLQLQKVE